MSEFKVIETQEDFDKAIKARLAQKDREVEEKFKDYLSPEKAEALKADYEKKLEEAAKTLKEVQEKAKGFDQTVSELTKRAESAETSLLKNKIAYEHKLPLELAGRLIGTTEEELTKDAESLSGLMSPKTAPPLHITKTNNPAQAGGDGMAALLASVNAQLQN